MVDLEEYKSELTSNFTSLICGQWQELIAKKSSSTPQTSRDKKSKASTLSVGDRDMPLTVFGKAWTLAIPLPHTNKC